MTELSMGAIAALTGIGVALFVVGWILGGWDLWGARMDAKEWEADAEYWHDQYRKIGGELFSMEREAMELRSKIKPESGGD